jgi:hypothetical protein
MSDIAGVVSTKPGTGLMRSMAVGNRRTFHLFLAVVGFSIAVRLCVLFAVRHIPFSSDAQDYQFVAQQLVSGHSFVPYWPPGLPLYLAPFVAAGASDVILRASMLVFWLLACWGLYRLMESLELSGVAWLVLLVFSLLPDSIQLSIEPLTQLPTAALLLVGLSSAVKVFRGASVYEFVLMGLSLGATSLVRPSAGVLLVVLPVACALYTRRVVPAFGSVILGFVLIGSWMVHSHAMTGRWVFNTANAYNMYYGNNPWTPNYRTWFFGSHAKIGTTEIDRFPEYKKTLEHVLSLPALERPEAFRQLTAAAVHGHFGLFLFRTCNRTRCFFGFDTFSGAGLSGRTWRGIGLSRVVLLLEAFVYLLIMVPSVFWIAQAAGEFWKDAANQLILATILLYAVPYWLSMSHPTYHFPILLPIAILGANAWRVTGGDRIRVRAWMAVAVLMAVQVEWVWRMAGAAV